MKNKKKRGVTVGSCLSFMFSDTPKNQFRDFGTLGLLGLFETKKARDPRGQRAFNNVQ